MQCAMSRDSPRKLSTVTCTVRALSAGAASSAVVLDVALAPVEAAALDTLSILYASRDAPGARLTSHLHRRTHSATARHVAPRFGSPPCKRSREGK